MSKPLRLLVVEDSEAAVAPLVHELRRHGYAPEAVHVDAAGPMRDALQRQAWDVVIADHALPRFSSRDAWRVLRESGLDLPFIIVSETPGEAAAVTAMKAGAHDYVMKDHLTRLGPAVERELQEAILRRQCRQTEQSLAAQHAVTRILAEADTLGEAGAKILQALAKNGEWEAGEIWTVVHQGDALRCLEIWHLPGKPLGEFATRSRAMTFARGVGLPGRVWASGEPAWIADVTQDANFPRAWLAAGVGLRGAIGLPIVVGHEVIGVLAFFRTTPGQPDEKHLAVLNAVGSQIGQFLVRQQAEEELRKLSSAAQHTTNSLLITDRHGVIEYVNLAFERTTGYAREDVIGKTPRLLKSGQHDQQYYETLWNTILAGGTFLAEFVNRKQSGELYHTEQSIAPIRDHHGHITHFVSTGRDITERARAEDALKLFRALVDQSHDTIEVVDPETGRFLDVNEKGHLVLGYSREEFLALSVSDLDPTVNPAAFPKVVEELRKSGLRMWEGIRRRKDGSTFPVEVNVKYVCLGRDYLVAVVRDISERQRAEDERQRLGDVLEASLNEIYIFDAQTLHFEYVNACARRNLGYGMDAMRALTPLDIKPEFSEAAFRELIGPLRRHEQVMIVFQTVHRRADGGRYPVEVHLQFVERGGKAVFVAVTNDITARQRAEEALRESEDRYRSLVEESPEAIGIYQAGKLVFINATGARHLGAKSKAELLDRQSQEFIHPDDFLASVDRVRRRLAGETGMYPAEVRYRRLDGTTLPVEVIATPITFRGKAAVQFIARDITERKQAEEALRRTEQLYRHAIAVAGAVPYDYDYQTGTYLFMGEGIEPLTGYRPEEISAALWVQIIQESVMLGEAAGLSKAEAASRIMRGEMGCWRCDMRILTRDGKTRWLSDVSVQKLDAAGQVIGSMGILQDITERKQAEQQLRDSAALYHSLVENLPQQVFRKDRVGRFTFGNGLFCQKLGKPLAEILGQTDLELFPAPLAAKYQQDDQHVVQTGHTLEGEEEYRQAGGQTTIVNFVKTPLRDAAGQIIGVQGIAWDITKKKQLEAHLLRVQRLESIGTLAGGVAHDLNNALAPILMATELLRLEFPDTASRYLELIRGGAQRGADMVKQLLTFAKGALGERLPIQPRYLLQEMQKLIESTFPKNIELRTRCAKDLRTILGDATQLHQVLLNLCLNARDAMPSGGTLTLEGENLEWDAIQANAVLEAKPGHYVVWRVKDTGTGMSPEILERIFEPFFSTKSPNKGTGLGLSTALGLVKSHGGFIRVYSVPGQGTTFAVYLPAHGSDAGMASLLTKTETVFQGNGETILVVDDEDAVCNVLRAVLTQLNFKVLTASDGAAALILAAENRTELRVVITDLHMPGMDGLALVRELKGRLPQTGIIVASGRMDDPEADEFKKLGVNAVLEKPFTQEKLVEALKTVLPK